MAQGFFTPNLQSTIFKQSVQRLKTVSVVGLLVMVGVVLQVAIASAAALLTRWQFDESANQLEITTQESTTPRYFLLTEPPRIVIDLPNTQLGSVPTQQTYSGTVRQIRVAQFEENVARIVLELSPAVALSPEQVQLQRVEGNSVENRWILRPLIAGKPTPTVLGIPAPAPTTTVSGQSSAMVTVPPLIRPGASPTPANFPPPSQPPNFSIPTLQSSPSVTLPSQPNSATVPVIEFGQPLPK